MRRTSILSVPIRARPKGGSSGRTTGGPFGFEDRSNEYPGAETPKAGQTVILIDPLHVPGNRYFERIESLFEAVAASGVERLPAERRYARRERSLRDGVVVTDRDWAMLQELLV
jgi:delta1-piperideine-2-carboxylate reductase